MHCMITWLVWFHEIPTLYITLQWILPSRQLWSMSCSASQTLQVYIRLPRCFRPRSNEWKNTVQNYHGTIGLEPTSLLICQSDSPVKLCSWLHLVEVKSHHWKVISSSTWWSISLYFVSLLNRLNRIIVCYIKDPIKGMSPYNFKI